MIAASLLMVSIGFVTTAVLAIKISADKSDLRERVVALDATSRTLKIALEENRMHETEEIERRDEIIEDLQEELELLYEEMDSCGDDAMRGRAAVLGIQRLLEKHAQGSRPGTRVAVMSDVTSAWSGEEPDPPAGTELLPKD